MKPVVNGLEKEYAGRVEIEKLNISDPKTAEARTKYRFRAQPYFVLLDAEGEVVNTWQGYTERDFFDEAFAAVLGP
jgi:thioredoxin-related protein